MFYNTVGANIPEIGNTEEDKRNVSSPQGSIAQCQERTWRAVSATGKNESL